MVLCMTPVIRKLIIYYGNEAKYKQLSLEIIEEKSH